jgi:hypothetical protein
VPSGLEGILEVLSCQRFVNIPLDWLVVTLKRAGLAPARQADLFRDVIRGPFRPVFFRSGWRTSNGAAGVRVAEAIYDDEAFDDLPILADALEDAGCDSDDLLSHLRQPSRHVRGCWALDLVLGRW